MLKRYGLAVLLALTVAVYARSLYSPFVFDDDLAITKNSDVIGRSAIVLHNPRWVTLTTFRVNYALGGTDPFGYHVVNLGLHLVNTFLVWILLLRLINPTAALLGAAFFSLHPLQSEAVIYISARSELLACCCGLLGMLLFEKGRYVWASLALVLALFSKEIAVVFPLMIAFREFLRRESAWKYLVPVGSLGLFAGSLFATYLESADRTLGDHALLQAGQFFRYLSILVLPLHQTIDHDAEVLPYWYRVLGIVLLATLAWCVFIFRQKNIHISLGIGYLLIPILPRFLIVTPELASEHHMYTSMLGAALLFGVLLVGNMRPASPGDNIVNNAASQTQGLGNIATRLAISKTAPNIKHGSIIHLGTTVANAAIMSFAALLAVATLPKHVLHIVFVGTFKQVRRVKACRVIAFVQNFVGILQLVTREHKCNAMNARRAALEIDCSIAMDIA